MDTSTTATSRSSSPGVYQGFNSDGTGLDNNDSQAKKGEFNEVSSIETTYRGMPATKVVSEQEIGKVSRVGSLVAGLVGLVFAIPFTPVAILSGDGFDAIPHGESIKSNFKELKSGVRKKTEYKLSAAPPRTKGYDPTDQDQLFAYFQSHPHQQLSKGAHQYILNAEDSSIILIPNGDKSKICEIKFWDLSSGEDITDVTRLEKSVTAFLVAHKKIEEQIKEMGDKAGRPVAFTHLVLDFDRNMVRGFNRPAPDANLGLMHGVKIELDKELWKTMTDLFDHNKTEGKQKLEETKGQKVHHSKTPMDDIPEISLNRNSKQPNDGIKDGKREVTNNSPIVEEPEDDDN